MNAAIRRGRPAFEGLPRNFENSYSFCRPAHTHLVSHAANGMDQGLGKSIIDLTTKVIDINIHHIGRGVEGEIPNVLDDHCASQPAAGIAHEIFEQSEFFCGQLNLTAGAFHLALHAIQTEITYSEDGLRRQTATP